MSILKNKTFQIILSFVTIALVAGLGSVFVSIGMPWFNLLQKPTQWIPNVVIPIVWTIVYGLFAVVNFFWIKNSFISKTTTILMFVNAFLNLLWCLVFFTFKLTFLGNIVIILNLIAGILLLVSIYKENKTYAYVLSLYPIWLSIATTLNLTLWILN